MTAEERWWQQQAEEWRRTALDRTRAAAESWIKAIGAITGLFGLLTIFRGPETLAGLSSGVRAAIGSLLLLTMLIALTAIALGALAARGRLQPTFSSAGAVRERYRQELTSAVGRLRASFVLSFLALVPLIAAVGVAWFAPRTSDRLLVTRADGSRLCVPRPPAGTNVTLPLDGVATITVVPSCPR